MKLIYLLIIGLFHLSFGEKYDVLIDISKTNYITTISKSQCVYIDTYEFEKQTEIGVKVTVYNGSFREDIMYYIGSNTIPFDVNPTVYENYDSSSYSGYDFGFNNFLHFTYYFKIPKANERYLFVSIPEFFIESDGYVEIGIGAPFPIWAIILIVLGGVIVISIIIIVIICYIRKSRTRNSTLPSSEPLYYPSNNSYVNDQPEYGIIPPGVPIYQ